MRGSLEVAGIGVLAVGFGWFAVGTGINLTAAENTGIITGAVTSTNGREAGVWVIAESDDFDTKFRKIVVTNDEGNFLLPELPAASYHVWVHIPAYLGSFFLFAGTKAAARRSSTHTSQRTTSDARRFVEAGKNRIEQRIERTRDSGPSRQLVLGRLRSQSSMPLLSRLFESFYVQVLLDFSKLTQHFVVISGPDLAILEPDLRDICHTGVEGGFCERIGHPRAVLRTPYVNILDGESSQPILEFIEDVESKQPELHCYDLAIADIAITESVSDSLRLPSGSRAVYSVIPIGASAWTRIRCSAGGGCAAATDAIHRTVTSTTSTLLRRRILILQSCSVRYLALKCRQQEVDPEIRTGC